LSRLSVIGLLVLALAAGCGGDDGGSAATAEWADGVCSAISAWGDSITATGESLRSGATEEDDLRRAVDELEEATQTLVDDLEGLGPPDTEAGQEAEETLDQLAEDVDENLSEISDAVDDASGATGLLEAATPVSATLTAMGQQPSSAFAELEQLDSAGELEDAFREADSCDELTEEGS
jgi:hypothetical protein